MGLAVAPQVVIDATKSLLQCTSMDDPSTLTSSGLGAHKEMGCALEHLVKSCKVLEPTRLDLGATTLLMMLNNLLMLMKILVMMLKTLVMVLKPLWMMEKPLMG